MHRILFLVLFISSNFFMYSQQLAFPTAYGSGAYTTGGRGGQVIHVTNLNNSGPGSFREALETTGTRTIVFDVSGIIDLQSDVRIEGSNQDNVTVAGQSAPEGGITITGGRIYFKKGNVIVRYIKFRNGHTSSNGDCLGFTDASDFIVDHCSFSYGTDEALDASSTDYFMDNITVQNCLFGESKTGLIIGDTGGTNFGGTSVLRNAFVNVGWRSPKAGGDIEFDVVNNIVHNWKWRLMRIDRADFSLNEINNYYQDGYNSYSNVDNDNGLHKISTNTSMSPQIYTNGNYVRPGHLSTLGISGYDSDNSKAYSKFTSGSSIDPRSEWFVGSQLPMQGRAITPIAASSLKSTILDDIGAKWTLDGAGNKVDARDSLDDDYVTLIQTNDQSSALSTGSYGALATSNPSNTRGGNYYVDNPHIPQTWFAANVPQGEDHNDIAPSGYTWLEEFLNQVDYQTSSNGQVYAGENVNICEGTSTTLTASGSQSYVWNTGETAQSITIQPIETTTYTVTGTDSEGNETTDSVTVTVNSMPNANAGQDEEICQDEGITLTASGGDSFEWSNGQTSQSITVSPSVTTTYSVIVTANGCSASDDVTVTVNPSPTVNAGNDVDIYQNESTTLTASGDGTFVWNTGETTQSITVSPLETTTYTVTADLNGCTSSDSVVVTVIEPDQVSAYAGEDQSICENESATLTASGGQSYLWSTGETTQSIVVSPTETTVYTVTVSNDFNSDSDDVVVTVNPDPIAEVSEDRTILHGESIPIIASGGSEYLWSTGETTQEIIVSPVETTTYTVEVFENGCSDIASTTVIVGVSASIAGEQTICQGESTTLYASGGSYFEWSTGENTQSIVVNPSQTTTYTVIVSNNSSSDEAEITVNVNLVPAADAGEDVTIEAGQNVTLTAFGGNTYLWSNGESTQSISVAPEDTTIYTVETFVNGCSNTDDVKVTVVPQVDASAGEDVEICLGETTTLTASGGNTYLWSNGESTQSITVTPSQTTIYNVEVSNGFSTQSAEVKVGVLDCESINNEPDDFGFEFKVYPNPTKDNANIRLRGLENVSSIFISDLSGHVIRSEIIEPNDGYVINKRYNLSSLSRGTYLITFKQGGNQAITKKLILN